MPEVHFTVRWPDGGEERCYSPSTVIADYLEPGATYPLPEFLARTRSGLNAASDRVAARFGFACTAAMAELARIEARALAFEAREAPSVALIRMDRGGLR